MLTLLTINNYAIVDNLELDLRQGMTAVSGETGAGKSIMLDALGLALGKRADSDAVRSGTERAEISASFDISTIHDAQLWLAEHDLSSDNDCILKRVITKEGRSRSYINGQLCPLNQIRAIGVLLVDIHGQHEHQRLLKKDHHRLLLDDFAGQRKLAEKMRLQHGHWQRQHKELKTLTEQNDSQRAQVQLLSYQIDELQLLAPTEGEIKELESEQKQLESASSILQTGYQVSLLASDNESNNCLSLMQQCQQLLSNLDLEHKTVLSVYELFSTAQIQLEEACSELNHYLATVEQNPQRLQHVEDRLSSLYEAARKHRIPPEQLPDFLQSLQEQLNGLQRSDDEVEALSTQVDTLKQQYFLSAARLSKARIQAAGRLSRAVGKQLTNLGMIAAHFDVKLTAVESDQPLLNGLEEVEFLISANKGQPPRALAKVASGGELSRISLAIQVITAQTSNTPTLIFDEVDVGIGGAIAEVVGKLLNQLGERCQILCVTHQPQVASQGHQHLFVSKKASKKQTQTQISHLSPNQRIHEIARMLGGIDITERSLAHAQEMLHNTYH